MKKEELAAEADPIAAASDKSGILAGKEHRMRHQLLERRVEAATGTRVWVEARRHQKERHKGVASNKVGAQRTAPATVQDPAEEGQQHQALDPSTGDGKDAAHLGGSHGNAQGVGCCGSRGEVWAHTSCPRGGLGNLYVFTQSMHAIN